MAARRAPTTFDARDSTTHVTSHHDHTVAGPLRAWATFTSAVDVTMIGTVIPPFPSSHTLPRMCIATTRPILMMCTTVLAPASLTCSRPRWDPGRRSATACRREGGSGAASRLPIAAAASAGARRCYAATAIARPAPTARRSLCDILLTIYGMFVWSSWGSSCWGRPSVIRARSVSTTTSATMARRTTDDCYVLVRGRLAPGRPRFATLCHLLLVMRGSKVVGLPTIRSVAARFPRTDGWAPASVARPPHARGWTRVNAGIAMPST